MGPMPEQTRVAAPWLRPQPAETWRAQVAESLRGVRPIPICAVDVVFRAVIQDQPRRCSGCARRPTCLVVSPLERMDTGLYPVYPA